MCLAFNEGNIINIFRVGKEILLPCELHLVLSRVIHYNQNDASLSLNPALESNAWCPWVKFPTVGRDRSTHLPVTGSTPWQEIPL